MAAGGDEALDLVFKFWSEWLEHDHGCAWADVMLEGGDRHPFGAASQAAWNYDFCHGFREWAEAHWGGVQLPSESEVRAAGALWVTMADTDIPAIEDRLPGDWKVKKVYCQGQEGKRRVEVTSARHGATGLF
mmetsp:Transcript_14997/g.42889  ORF Transcript_14997/g.42889 Transcript_14997/m.42889 type:complete len:132 (-) Transcript_14997:97-492(-)